MGGQIPLIDLQELEGLPEKLREASEKWGCFRIVNHGVPTKLMADMKQVGKDLHELPLEIKLRNKDVLPRSGYAPANERSPFHEALGLFDAGTSSSVSLFCSQLDASPQQRETVELYSQAMYKLLIDLANKLAKGMGLEDFCFDGWLCQSKINKYTFTAKSIGSFGFHPHTDVAFINILHEDENIGGLEVMDPNGAFVDADHVPGSLVVLLGDIAVPWSNGRLCNVQHGVLCKNLGLRYTIVISISPPLGKAVEAPPEFVDADHPRLYSPFTYEEFRELRAAKRLTGDKALEVIRLQN